jgi:hypothetical protein
MSVVISKALVEKLERFDDTEGRLISDWFSCYRDQTLTHKELVTAYLEAVCRVSSGGGGSAEFVQKITDLTRHDHFMWFALLTRNSAEFKRVCKIYDSTRFVSDVRQLCKLYSTLKSTVDKTLATQPENPNLMAMFVSPLGGPTSVAQKGPWDPQGPTSVAQRGPSLRGTWDPLDQLDQQGRGELLFVYSWAPPSSSSG